MKLIRKLLSIVYRKLALYSLLIVTSLVTLHLYHLTPHTYNLYVGEMSYDNIVQMKYDEFILNYATTGGDTVNILLNTPGGDNRIGDELLYSIRHSSAFVHMFTGEEVGSYGTLLLFQGDILTVDDNTTLVFHRAYIPVGGIESYSNKAVLEKVLGPTDRGSITADEIIQTEILPLLSQQVQTDLLNGKDIYMSGKTFKVLWAQALADHKLGVIPEKFSIIDYNFATAESVGV